MGKRKVAVVGAGMTRFVRRAQETGKELSWQAAHMALESCEMTLDDVERYISKNGHLPDVSPAKVVEKEGISLGESQTILLQKIEELTLYLIEQKNTIKDMKNEIAMLKKKRK